MVKLSLRLSLLLVVLFNSCVDSESINSYKPAYTGRQGEIVIVAPKAVWALDETNFLKRGVLGFFPGLPADEPMFTTVEVNKEAFSEVFKTHRNLLEFRIDPSNELNVVKRKNVYAKNQLHIIITFNSSKELQTFSGSGLSTILKEFHRAEIDRLVSRNLTFGNKDLNKDVSEITGVSIILQEGVALAKTTSDNTVWLRIDREKPVGGLQHQINQGILIYSRPYTDTLQFSDSSLLAWKSKINKALVVGPKESYMSISDRYIPPNVTIINYNKSVAKEIRGLWRMGGVKGVFMGGPFYSLAFYNDTNKKQYMVEGYVYGPQFNKRAFIREIEAMVKSVRPLQ